MIPIVLWISCHFLYPDIISSLSYQSQSLDHQHDCPIIEGKDAHAQTESQIASDISYKTITAVDIVLILHLIGISFKEEG
jgi:hypothetical protein